jgi:hypothetical protein
MTPKAARRSAAKRKPFSSTSSRRAIALVRAGHDPSFAIRNLLFAYGVFPVLPQRKPEPKSLKSRFVSVRRGINRWGFPANFAVFSL